MSKIAIIGATGRAGSQLLEEALRRGHSVTAIARDTSKIGARAGVVSKNVDVLDAAALQDAVAGDETGAPGDEDTGGGHGYSFDGADVAASAATRARRPGKRRSA